MVSTVRNYLSLVKFSHTIFAMPFAMIGFFLAVSRSGNGLHWELFLLVVLCMVFARSAAMAFNRLLDARIDARNPRTASREIPQGVISLKNAAVFTVVNCLLFILTTFFINPLCFFLSPVALLIVLGYSYTKRFTALCHLVLGLGLSLAPIGAFLAVTGHFSLLPLLFSLIVLCWVSGFDIIYSLQDEAFDKSLDLHSVPAWMGKKNALHFSELLHLFAALLVIIAGKTGQFGMWYWIGSVVFISMLIYQHLLVKPGDLRRVNIAFMTTNGVASCVFALFVIMDLLIG